MKNLALICVLICSPALASAQAVPDTGPSLMERGAQMFLDGMMQEMSPALEDLSELGEKIGPALRDFANEMGPALGSILESVEDWSVYEAPEILPNGDILIKRKPEPETPKGPMIFLDKTPQIDI
jgi:hypothetical protein